ncbi:MAG: ATP-binding protein [Thermoanaerobaculia bacterium]
MGLRSSEVRYRQILESAKAGIWILDGATGEILDVNPYLLERLGYDRSEMVGHHSWERIVIPDVATQKARLQTLRDIGYPCEADVVMHTRSGSVVAIEAISNLYSINQRQYIQATCATSRSESGSRTRSARSRRWSRSGASPADATMIAETFPRMITVAVELAPDLPLIKADPNQLHQALLNLCVNARDAMDQGGRLTLRSELLSGPELKRRFSEVEAAQYVGITVADSGTGMDAAVQERIFEPFFTTKGLGAGSGLGLPVVYGIVNAHRGFLKLESEAGQGTTVRLFLPAAEGAEKPEKPLPAAVPRGGSETILLVEDEDLLLDSVKTILQSEGYTVLPAHDGVEAVELFRAHRKDIHVVLSDLELPRLGGWEAFLQMREIDPDVKMILASGYVDPGRQGELVGAGVQAVIGKPYTADGLLIKLRQVLGAWKKRP